MRLESIKQKMGGSDHKNDKAIEKALELLPVMVLLEMSDEQIAQFAHNAAQAVHEAWRSGHSSGERSARQSA